MPTKKRGSGSRDLGLNHGAGKGDADRSDPVIFKKNFPKALKGQVAGFARIGSRLVKVYGKPGREIRTRTVVKTGELISKADKDFNSAQALANQANAEFRKQGFDTCGH